MSKKLINLVVCIAIILSFIPVGQTAYATTIGEDVFNNVPIDSSMETSGEITYIDNQISTDGSASLSMNRKFGEYSAKVMIGDTTSNVVEFTLVQSNAFTILDYSLVELWIKPGDGASKSSPYKCVISSAM